MRLDLTPPKLLSAYASGIFPMADNDGTVQWLAPDPRCILEFDELYVSRSLRTTLRRGTYEVRVNSCFPEVIQACAGRERGTWISDKIIRAYVQLYRLGFAHSVEAWKDGTLAGGLYGVAIGGAFFGESMFHRATDASKVALIYLVERLVHCQFALLDVQFLTAHLKSLGAREIPRAVYQRRLRSALGLPCSFVDEPQVTPIRRKRKSLA